MSENSEINGHEVTLTVGNHITECMKTYVEYTTEDRALPNILDGLKPVARRLLYAANMLGMKPSGKTFKSARLVGDVMGKYHPHGDMGIYGGLVTMASGHSSRNPLFDAEQGNWGDGPFGDKAAAHRYTETTLTALGAEFLKDLAHLDMMPNFDGTEMEPVVLCPPFPAVLLNDNMGVAAGMATNLPSHNIGNICDATLAFLKNENCRDSTLIEAIQGPDDVTGGIIHDYDENREGLVDLYVNGRGRLWFGLNWEIQPSDDKNWKKMLVIKSLAPGFGGMKLLEGGMFEPLLATGEIDIFDNSTGSLNIEINVYYNNSAVIVNGLLPQISDISQTYTLNVIDYTEEHGALVEKEIIQTNLRYILSRWLSFRREIISRRIEARMADLRWERQKLEVQEYLATHPKEREMMFAAESDEELNELLTKVMKFNERQAAYAPTLQVRTLMRLNHNALIDAMAGVDAKLDEQQGFANDIDAVITQEVRDIKKRFGDERRVLLFQDPKPPKVVHQTYLLTADKEGELKANTSWPAQGKGLGNSLAATFAEKAATVVNYEGKARTAPPFELAGGYNDYAMGFASDKDSYLVVLDEDGNIYIRTMPEDGFAKLTKVSKANVVAAHGVAEGQGIMVRMKTAKGDNTAFHYFSPKNLYALARDGLKPAYSLWWDDDTLPIGLVVTGPNTEIVTTNGRPVDVDWEDYESLHKYSALAVDVSNLVTYQSGRANILKTKEVFDTLSTVASSIPLFGEFSKDD
jgi:DNA gyrase/topoisomerase IV subunit A